MKKRLIAQGCPFEFTLENVQTAQTLIARYPKGREASALVPLLDLAQRQCQGWLPQEAVEYVAYYLNLSMMQVYEVASFYSMFNLAPVGKYFVQVCTTTPCQLSGAQRIVELCHQKTGTTPGHNSPDGLFTVIEVECLGACIHAPVIQINDDYYENMDAFKTQSVLESLKSDQNSSGDNFSSTSASLTDVSASQEVSSHDA